MQDANALAAILQAKGFGYSDLAVGLPTLPHHTPPKVVPGGHRLGSITKRAGRFDRAVRVFADAEQLWKQDGAVKGPSCAEATLLGESSDELIRGPNWVVRGDGWPGAARALPGAIVGTPKTSTCKAH